MVTKEKETLPEYPGSETCVKYLRITYNKAVGVPAFISKGPARFCSYKFTVCSKIANNPFAREGLPFENSWAVWESVCFACEIRELSSEELKTLEGDAMPKERGFAE